MSPIFLLFIIHLVSLPFNDYNKTDPVTITKQMFNDPKQSFSDEQKALWNELLVNAQQGDALSAWHLSNLLDYMITYLSFEPDEPYIEAITYWDKKALEGKCPYALINPHGSQWNYTAHKEISPELKRQLEKEGFTLLDKKSDKTALDYKNLSDCYLYGIGTVQDINKAREYYIQLLKKSGCDQETQRQELEIWEIQIKRK